MGARAKAWSLVNPFFTSISTERSSGVILCSLLNVPPAHQWQASDGHLHLPRPTWLPPQKQPPCSPSTNNNRQHPIRHRERTGGQSPSTLSPQLAHTTMPLLQTLQSEHYIPALPHSRVLRIPRNDRLDYPH